MWQCLHAEIVVEMRELSAADSPRNDAALYARLTFYRSKEQEYWADRWQRQKNDPAEKLRKCQHMKNKYANDPEFRERSKKAALARYHKRKLAKKS